MGEMEGFVGLLVGERGRRGEGIGCVWGWRFWAGDLGWGELRVSSRERGMERLERSGLGWKGWWVEWEMMLVAVVRRYREGHIDEGGVGERVKAMRYPLRTRMVVLNIGIVVDGCYIMFVRLISLVRIVPLKMTRTRETKASFCR